VAPEPASAAASTRPRVRERFLKACRMEPVDATPVWFMRQAGRYLPEYRELRGESDVLALTRDPEAAAEIALQPFGIPLIHFGTGTGELLGMMREAGAGVIGVDWRVPLDVAWDRIGHDAAIQGNLDPAALLGSWDAAERKAERVLERAAGRPGHVFNLGHGVMPATPPEHLQRLVDLVHELSARER
jgi:uroporphyrinogen-III decarboxylase